MKALIYDGVETLGFRDVADPTPLEAEHLIRVEAVGICGSDMHAYLGHDAHRVTDAFKAGRENICPERQIISMPAREGAFAQYISMPESNLVPVPDDVPLSTASLAEPLAVSWHIAKLALDALHPAMEKRALVFGGGAIGLADVTIVEPSEGRRAYLTEICQQNVIAEARDQYSLVIDAVGFAATGATASAVTLPGGVIAHAGLGDHLDGLDVRRMTLQDFRDTAQAIFDGKLGPLNWTETRPLGGGVSSLQRPARWPRGCAQNRP